jgi:hypothetical protein
MVMRESDKHFLWSMLGATGIILFWRGLWEGIGSLPLLESPWVSLFIGLLILTLSGMIFQQFDPMGGIDKGALQTIHSVHHHPQRHEFTMKYYDNLQKKVVDIAVHDIKHIERNVLTIHSKGKEIFVPIHRIREIHRNGKIFWKL